MINFHNYEFSVLRYVHDTLTGEFVNVGVVMYSAKDKWVAAQCRSTYSRVSAVFPDLNSSHFKKMMKFIQTEISETNDRISSELPLNHPDSLRSLLHALLPKDDSALQWSTISAGITRDLQSELAILFERYVSHYDIKSTRERRTEQEIWKDFSNTLKSLNLPEKFEAKKISVQDDEVVFQHSWKNGIWHCIEPLSFDLIDQDYFKDKAHRWLGQLSSIKNAEDEFKVYLLVSPPSEAELNPAFTKALSILKKIPVESEIYLESDAPKLAEVIHRKMEAHNQAN